MATFPRRSSRGHTRSVKLSATAKANTRDELLLLASAASVAARAAQGVVRTDDAIVDSQAEGTGDRRRRREAYLCVWRAHLSVELMEGRVRWRQHQLDQLVNPECEEHLKGLKQHWVNQVAQRQSRPRL